MAPSSSWETSAAPLAPDFELTTLDGNRVKLSDYRGKAVLLNFWATWCSPCKVEMPWFVDMQKHYGNDGLVILGVAMDDSDTPKIAQFASEMGVNYPVLLGTDKVSEEYGNVCTCLPVSISIVTARSSAREPVFWAAARSKTTSAKRWRREWSA